jgi:hypothetical protein
MYLQFERIKINQIVYSNELFATDLLFHNTNDLIILQADL